MINTYFIKQYDINDKYYNLLKLKIQKILYNIDKIKIYKNIGCINIKLLKRKKQTYIYKLIITIII